MPAWLRNERVEFCLAAIIGIIIGGTPVALGYCSWMLRSMTLLSAVPTVFRGLTNNTLVDPERIDAVP